MTYTLSQSKELVNHVTKQKRGLITIFGHGNVNKVKVQPALCHLTIDKKLNDQAILIVASDLITEGAEKALLRQDLLDHGFTESQVEDYLKKVNFLDADLTNPHSYDNIMAKIHDIEVQYGLQSNRIAYLGLPYTLFATVIKGLGKKGFFLDKTNKVIVEKPFGKNLETARQLNRILAEYCQESQIYRLDHYLLKEALQNLMSWRFANIFEPIWNRNYIESITILALENSKVSNTVNNEEKYRIYDGAFADMIQNHLLEVLLTTIMDTPISLNADDIRSEKVKMLRCIKASPNSLMMGKYEGYEGEKETLAGITFVVKHPRWEGVEPRILTAKGVDRKLTQIMVKFRNQSMLFPNNNRLIFRLQPNEGIIWECGVKDLGNNTIVTKPLQWLYNGDNGFNARIPDAYETMFLQVIEGNTSLFVRNDEVEGLWDAVSPVISQLEISHQNGNGNSPVFRYPIGLNPNTLVEFTGLDSDINE